MRGKAFRMGNLKGRLLKLFSILFICFSIYIVIISTFNSVRSFHKMNPLIIIIGTILLLILLYYINEKLKKVEYKRLKQITIVAFIIMLIMQIVFIVALYITPSWDYARVISEARELAIGNHSLTEYYYELYPNNIGITLLLGLIFKPISIFTDEYAVYLSVAIIFNIIMINLSLYILYKLIYKMFGIDKATLFSIFMLLVTPFYSYSQIVYTDTITMVFPIAMFSILYNYVNSKTGNKIINLIIIGMLGGVGTILKSNVIIALIAILIYLIFTNKLFISIKRCLILIIPFVIVMGIYQSIASNFIPIPYKEAGLPYTHWIMMGLKQPYGGYYSEDVKLSTNARLTYGKEGAKKVNIEVIKNRIKEYGVFGYLKFINDKVSITWGDGTYYAPNKLARHSMRENKLKEYVIGDKNAAFVYVSQMSHILMFICMILGGIKTYKRETDFVQTINISIFGMFLMLILWETRSRYVIGFLPVIVLASSYGIDDVFNIISKILVSKLSKRKNI